MEHMAALFYSWSILYVVNRAPVTTERMPFVPFSWHRWQDLHQVLWLSWLHQTCQISHWCTEI